MRQLSGVTGDLFESRLLSEEQQKRLRSKDRDFSQSLEKVPYQNYEDALAEAIGNTELVSDDESHDPPSRWLNDLHAEIAEALNLEDYTALRVIPTVGNALDIYHNTDLIIMYQDPNSSESPIIVTADLTLNPKGKNLNRTSVDLLITDKGPVLTAMYKGLIDNPEPVKEIAYSSAKEDRQREAKVRENIAEIIKEIIEYKKTFRDREYRKEQTRNAVRAVFTRGDSK